MSNRVYTLEEIAAIIAPIAARYDVDKIYIFGSTPAEKPMKAVTLICALKLSPSKVFSLLADCIPILRKRLEKSLI